MNRRELFALGAAAAVAPLIPVSAVPEWAALSPLELQPFDAEAYANDVIKAYRDLYWDGGPPDGGFDHPNCRCVLIPRED